MLVVMTTFSSSEHGNDDYDYAVYKLEQQEAQILAHKFNLFKVMHDSDPEMVEMVFHAEDETLCEFFPHSIWMVDEFDNMPKELLKDLDKDRWGILPEDYAREFTPKDAHAPRVFLAVTKEGFFWRAYPDNSELTIETQSLPKEILARVL